MEASWNDCVIASSDDIVKLEGNAYFPPQALRPECFRPSTHRSVSQRVYTWLHTLKCGCTCNRTKSFPTP